jgi:hypothetical protein
MGLGKKDLRIQDIKGKILKEQVIETSEGLCHTLGI